GELGPDAGRGRTATGAATGTAIGTAARGSGRGAGLRADLDDLGDRLRGHLVAADLLLDDLAVDRALPGHDGAHTLLAGLDHDALALVPVVGLARLGLEGDRFGRLLLFLADAGDGDERRAVLTHRDADLVELAELDL